MKNVGIDIAILNKKERRRQLFEIYLSAGAALVFAGAIALGVLWGIGLL